MRGEIEKNYRERHEGRTRRERRGINQLLRAIYLFLTFRLCLQPAGIRPVGSWGMREGTVARRGGICRETGGET